MYALEHEKTEETDEPEDADEPEDMIDSRYLDIYREIGRERFIEILMEHVDEELTPETFRNYVKQKDCKE